MTAPRVTIGLVVRNGEKHLAAAVRSFLAQTFTDFELVIHDNASTDATPAIAAELAAADPRIRVARRVQNIGALGNLIAAGEEATSEYFCWAAHDDVREPTFLATLVELLDQTPSAGLACCAVRDMLPDGSDAGIRPETASLRTSVGMRPAERVAMYLRGGAGTPFYGLFRTRAMQASLDVLRRDGVPERRPAPWTRHGLPRRRRSPERPRHDPRAAPSFSLWRLEPSTRRLRIARCVPAARPRTHERTPPLLA
jgi:glycosyltransferase involved in cell wall biosynthesis